MIWRRTELEDMPHLWEKERRMATFQANYKEEISRQVELSHINANAKVIMAGSSEYLIDGEDCSVGWEDA
jgi:hypothetical protein